MIVWRIEHKRSGMGPFNHDAETSGDPAATKAREIAYSSNIPSPWDAALEPSLKTWRDLSMAEQHVFVFGFSSRHQLRCYFPPSAMRELRGLGFTVALYRTDDTLTVQGWSQVAFVPQAAVRLTNARRQAKAKRSRRPRPAINQGGKA